MALVFLAWNSPAFDFLKKAITVILINIIVIIIIVII